ncbi:MAG: LPS export ABC transporter periplasmic protein LptC [Abditibacteriaceae bacterium]
MKSLLKVLLLACCISALSGCSYFSPQQTARDAIKAQTKKVKSKLDTLRTATLSGTDLSGTDDAGRPLWKITAKTIRAKGNPKGDGSIPANAELTDAHAILYSNGKPESQYDSPRMQLQYEEDGNVRILLSGGVKAIAQGSWTKQRGSVQITTPQAIVNIKKRQLWTNHSAKIEQGKGTEQLLVVSKTLLANTSLKTADLGGGVTSTTSRGVMTANSANWNWATGQLAAEGKVSAHGTNINISGQHLSADTNAHLVTVSGDVTAKSDKGTATASKVLYRWDSGKLMATGNVHLQDNGATVSASQIDTTKAMGDATASGGVQVRRGDLKVQANSATVTKMGDKAFAVTGNGAVKVQAPQGWAKANHATWKNGQISANGNVTLSHDGYSIRGDNLNTDDKFKQATLTGDVHGAMAGGGTMSAGKAVYSGGKVVASGGVSGQKGDLRMKADRLESNADGKLVELTGNVTVRNSDGTTISAPQARYDRDKKIVYAWGDVTLHDLTHHLTQHGKTLTADLNLKQAVLTDVSGSGKMIVLQGKKLF